jgi:hypothetical protein
VKTEMNSRCIETTKGRTKYFFVRCFNDEHHCVSFADKIHLVVNFVRLGGFRLLFLCLAILPDSLNATDGDSEKTRMERKWDESRKLVDTLEVSGFKFSGSFRSANFAPERDEFVDFVKHKLFPHVRNQQSRPTIEELELLTDQYFARSPRPHGYEGPSGIWRSFKFASEDQSVRSDEAFKAGDITVIRQENGELESRNGSFINQASVRPQPSIRSMDDVEHFLFTPFSSSPVNTAWWIDRSIRDDSLLLRGEKNNESIEVRFNSSEGFLLDCRRFVQDVIRFERLHDYPISVASGADDILFPHCIVECRYAVSRNKSSSWLKIVTVDLIDSIVVNRNLAPDRFKLAIPAGTNIVRFDEGTGLGAGKREPPSEVASEPISDLAAFVRDPKFGQRSTTAAAAPLPESSLRSKLFVYINLIAIAILSAFWLRQRTHFFSR